MHLGQVIGDQVIGMIPLWHGVGSGNGEVCCATDAAVGPGDHLRRRFAAENLRVSAVGTRVYQLADRRSRWRPEHLGGVVPAEEVGEAEITRRVLDASSPQVFSIVTSK